MGLAEEDDSDGWDADDFHPLVAGSSQLAKLKSLMFLVKLLSNCSEWSALDSD